MFLPIARPLSKPRRTCAPRVDDARNASVTSLPFAITFNEDGDAAGGIAISTRTSPPVTRLASVESVAMRRLPDEAGAANTPAPRHDTAAITRRWSYVISWAPGLFFRCFASFVVSRFETPGH